MKLDQGLLYNRFIFTLSVCIFVIFPSSLQAWTGQVIGISDGDTIAVLRNNQQIRIRLHGIDTPESGQAYGKQAKKFTKRLTAGKFAEIERTDTDRYGRTVALVTVDGTSVNREVVAAGYGWVFRKYCKQTYCREWLQLEQHARTARIGLWRDKNPVPPWEWRKRQRESPQAAAVAGSFHGNAKSHVFHARGCRYFNCKNCMIGFKSEREAIRAGYRPHRECVNDN